jgi:nucleoside-diphosphate-sugar epimerase
MSRGRVVLTGASGFIGSHVAEALLAEGFDVIALRRRQSNAWRLAAVTDQITWLSTDETGWEQQLLALKPEYLVHSAWLGVSAGQRDDWEGQLTNLSFTVQLLQLLAQGPIRKVVALGSQAEYGFFEGRIDEAQPINPTSAYGAVKVATMQLLKAFCEAHDIEWYWLRIFSVFGPREDLHWFVSFVASSLLQNQATNLTACEQQYDYTFAPDLAKAIVATLLNPQDNRGVYNVSSNQAEPLRQLVETMKHIVGASAQVNYGAVPYRAGQVMHMEGNSNKFEHVFGRVSQTPLPVALAETVASIKSRI